MPLSILEELFSDTDLVVKIQSKLPLFFQIAELESSRAGKIGMEVGTIREKILISLLIYKYGTSDVNTEIPTTEAEIDVIIRNTPISIKTVSGKYLTGVKLSWTVDRDKAAEFQKDYIPRCDMLFVHINWGGDGGFYYVPQHVQRAISEDMGRGNYLKPPKQGTNPRGVEIYTAALKKLIAHPQTSKIIIKWEKREIPYNPYERWVELWKEK